MRLVISDAHGRLRASIERVMLGAAWQRCRVHFMRNLLARVPKGSQEMVAAAIRTVFAQPDGAAVADHLDSIADKLGRQFPVVEEMLREAATGICAFAAFPTAHWKKVWSTHPLERVNKDIKRRTNVVGIFPNEAGVLRLVGSILPLREVAALGCCSRRASHRLEVHDEWQVGSQDQGAARRLTGGRTDAEDHAGVLISHHSTCHGRRQPRGTSLHLPAPRWAVLLKNPPVNRRVWERGANRSISRDLATQSR